MSFSVVVLSKTAANFVACAEAIRKAGETCRICVIDDGLDLDQITATGSCTFCELDPIKTVPGEKPFVFSRNANVGIRAAGEDDVILLNDDALLKTPAGFSQLSSVAQSHPEYGVIAAVTNSTGNQAQLPQNRGLREEPRMVCFICVYIPRKTIERVGLLDERFIHYGMDDDDYCLRVRQAGLKIGIFDGCFVDHATLKSSFRGMPGTGGDYLPNLAIFKEKWGFDNWGN